MKNSSFICILLLLLNSVSSQTITDYEKMLKSAQTDLSELVADYRDIERKIEMEKAKLGFSGGYNQSASEAYAESKNKIINLQIQLSKAAGDLQAKQLEIDGLKSKILELFNKCNGVLGISWGAHYDQVMDEVSEEDLLRAEKGSMIIWKDCFGVRSPLILEFSEDGMLVKAKAWVNYKKRVSQEDFDTISGNISEVLGEPSVVEDGGKNFLFRRIWQAPESLIDHRVEQSGKEIFHSVVFTRIDE